MTNAPQYTREVGRKFHADGSPRLFPGNTIICFVSPDSPIGQAAGAFQNDLYRQPFGPAFALLPPSSFHMTVMELLCDQVRVAERWSSHLTLDTPLAAADARFVDQVPPLSMPAPLTMRVDRLLYQDNMTLTLQATDAATADALRDYRATVASATGVRFPNHDTYGFHISLAYQLIELTSNETTALDTFCRAWEPRLRDAGSAISLASPVLACFDTMLRFVPAAECFTLLSRQNDNQP
ncbi:MAG: DUF1868 domain-containing protein [Roseiflexaceae bacterium]|nr:DUF1868 domain-containing protein [Roseiflexaceae bacterium]